MLPLLAILLQAAAAPAPEAPPGAPPSAPADEVVVVGHRGRCTTRIADRLISDREFRARAAEWAAGRSVRIIVPAGSDYRCMARIMFRLNRYGVRNAVFVTR